MDQADFDQRVFDHDEEEGLQYALAQAYLMRPLRSAWRDDLANAPLRKPVYARETDSIRVIIALRDDDDEWTLITRDGELQPLEGVAAWAPLESALG